MAQTAKKIWWLSKAASQEMLTRRGLKRAVATTAGFTVATVTPVIAMAVPTAVVLAPLFLLAWTFDFIERQQLAAQRPAASSRGRAAGRSAAPA